MALQVKGRILVVDDQENWRKALSKLLQEYEVSLASDVDQATDALREFRFDVAVLDVRLIDQDSFNVDGIDVLRMLRQNKLRTGVIVLTGYPESIRDEILDKYAPDRLIFKVPEGSRFDASGFLETVEELVREYRV